MRISNKTIDPKGQTIMRIFSQLNAQRVGKSLLILATYVGISVVSLSGANAAAPVFTSSTSFSINENSTTVGTVAADVSVTYSVLPLATHPSSLDAAFFSVDSSTGVLSITARNFEAPADNGINNIYNVVVRADSGTSTTDQILTITILNVNEAPVITSGSGDTATISKAENTTAVTTVTSTDVDASATATYSLAGGTNVGQFAIDTATGVLTMTAQNFETLVGTLQVIVGVSDGALTDTQTITVTITDVNEFSPVITSGSGDTATVNAAENQSAVTTVTSTDGDTATSRTYSLAGGTNVGQFAIGGSSGVLTITAQDFETLVGTLEVIVAASDGTNTDTQTITVTITNVNEAPVITSNSGGATATVIKAENTTAVTTVTSTDVDASATATYSLAGGADIGLFAIDTATGVLTMTAQDFENPENFGNTLVVIVGVTDGALTDTQTITVDITNVNEFAPVITSDLGGDTATVNAAENQSAVTTVTSTDTDTSATATYSLAGGADVVLFAIDTATGVLTMTAQNFEIPYYVGNTLVVIVGVTDGLNTDTQTITVTITNVNETPVITSNDGGATAAISKDENTTAVTTVTSTDVDASATKTFSLAGGANSGQFAIDTATGVLTMTAQNFETLVGTLEVIVGVTDGALTDTQTITVTITDVNEFAPVITSDLGGDTATVNAAENQSAVTTVTSTDDDASATDTYSLAGGADVALFAIDADSGVLTMTAQDFETLVGTLEVIVAASDGTNTDTQTITVTITDENDVSPAITSNDGGDTATIIIAENTIAVTTVTSTDVDLSATATYSLAGGADSALFAIDTATGVLIMVAQNFESPAHVGNTLEVIVGVTDGALTDTQIITVTITDVNEFAPVITSNLGGDAAAVNAAENQSAVTTVTSTDTDASATATYSLAGGADAALFAIDTATGVLTMTAQDFETAGTLQVIVGVTDGLNTDTQTIIVTITNVDDTSPTVLGVTSSATNGSYVVGNVIDIQVTFDETVTVTGVPTLGLSTGVEGRTANYISGSGSTVLTFRYVVGQGDLSADLEYVGVASLTVTSASIQDADLNSAVTTLPDTSTVNSLGGSKSIAVDATAPTGLIVTPGAGSLTISVTEPTWNATLYTFEVSSDDAITWKSIVSAQKSITFGGLTAGLGYLVRVAGLATVPNLALVSASQHVAGAYVTSGITKYEPTSVAGPAGPAGETGTAGAPGAAGPAGDTGTAGAPGVAGPAGPAGASGGSGAPGAAAINPQATLLLVFANSSVPATLTSAGTLTGGTGAGAVTFSTTDEKICTVSNLGVVTGVKVGECAIVATKAASAGYLEAKSNPVILKVTDSPADVAAAKAKADADAAAVAKAKADADAAVVAKAKADADAAAKAKADADAAAVAKAKADADAAAKAKADADAVAAKIAEAKAQADAAVKAAADAMAATEKATADAKAAADLAAATAQAKADSDAEIAKIAAANAMTIGVRSKAGYTTIKTDLADKYSGMKAVVQLVVVKSGKTTYVTLGTVYLDELGKGSTKTKTVIAKGQKVRVTVAGKVIKTVTK